VWFLATLPTNRPTVVSSSSVTQADG